MLFGCCNSIMFKSTGQKYTKFNTSFLFVTRIWFNTMFYVFHVCKLFERFHKAYFVSLVHILLTVLISTAHMSFLYYFALELKYLSLDFSSSLSLF